MVLRSNKINIIDYLQLYFRISIYTLNPCFVFPLMKSMKMEKCIQCFKQKGFAVLTTVIILSVAGIIYTLNMAHSQLIDNRILGNIFRNNEALVHAESGINLILNKLSHLNTAEDILNHLPFTYPEMLSDTNDYQILVKYVDDTDEQQLLITSMGYSQDKTATKTVSLKVERIEVFDIPVSALSSNGMLKINSKGNINTGCEGLAKADCRSPGNIAEQAVLNQVSSESNDNELCVSDENDSLLTYDVKNIVNQEWGEATSFAGTLFDGVTEISEPNSLFQRTFGISLNDAKQVLAFSDKVASVDMTDSPILSCSEQLNAIDPDISVIYIKGDCEIEADSEHFTIGTSSEPKMIFFEGGSFSTQANTGVSVNGLLYFIPSTQDVLDENGEPLYIDGVKQTIEQQSIDMSGIRINGALLSEYNCSHNESDKDNNANTQHFSVRYDKTVLNTLYSQLELVASATHYQMVAGSWKDF